MKIEYNMENGEYINRLYQKYEKETGDEEIDNYFSNKFFEYGGNII